MSTKCTWIWLHLCWVAPAKPPEHFDASVFGFGEFIAALALLVIVYTTSDFRYRFRINAAPLRLRLLTFWMIAFIGSGTLLTEVWLREGWPVLNEAVIDQSKWEAILGALFLALSLLWMFFAFIKPQCFGRFNYLYYANAVYWTILKGADDELPTLADELASSAEALVTYSRLDVPRYPNDGGNPPDKRERQKKREKSKLEDVAHDLLLMIGNRKLCRAIAASSPGTAIAFFNAAAAVGGRAGLPLGQFSKNLSTEAISNKDSILYHETEGFEAGYFGYIKPFSEAVYGNYGLVESLGERFGSPLDIRYDEVWEWDEAQLFAYTRVTIVAVKAYLREGRDLQRRSFALNRALKVIKDACRDLYKVNGTSDYDSDTIRRFSRAVDFVDNVISAIAEEPDVRLGPIRAAEIKDWSFLDRLVHLMMELSFAAAAVKSGSACWSVQYLTLWNTFFHGMQSDKVWRIVRRKLRRQIYKEICRKDRRIDFQSAALLGLCLNVMGFNTGRFGGFGAQGRPLKRALLLWTKRNFLRVHHNRPVLARAILSGGVTFDEEHRRLIKTYASGLERVPDQEYLDLDPYELPTPTVAAVPGK